MLNVAGDGAPTAVEILDLLGRVHYRDAAIAGKTSLALDLRHLPTGVYVVRLHGGPHPTSFRIVKN